jgi:hypothetical protein
VLRPVAPVPIRFRHIEHNGIPATEFFSIPEERQKVNRSNNHDALHCLGIANGGQVIPKNDLAPFSRERPAQ